MTTTPAGPGPQPLDASEALPAADAATRRLAGRAARTAVPRSAHAAWEPRPDRLDPVELLVEQGRTRVPELLPIRYGRMTASPFAFLRGSALVMASDLATGPVSGIDVQACGDAHLSNFGIYGTPERRLVFDINDFDETSRGPWEWDVKRLAASLAVAGRDRGFGRGQRRRAVREAARQYREAMLRHARQGNLDLWYGHLDVDDLLAGDALDPAARRELATQAVKARTKDNRQAFARLVHSTADGPRIASSPPLVVPLEEITDAWTTGQLQSDLTALLSEYGETLSPDRRTLLGMYRPVHMARKVVGVGSVGTRCWIVLLHGHDTDDPLLLQVKQAEESVVARFTTPSPFGHHGERVVVGQKLMQAASDLFLGWNRVEHGLDGRARDFYVRQLRDWKGSVDVTKLRPATMRRYAGLCGATLARAHARTGDRDAIAGYLGGGRVFDDAIADFAESYADQTERDLAALRAAVDDGRLEAVTGV